MKKKLNPIMQTYRNDEKEQFEFSYLGRKPKFSIKFSDFESFVKNIINLGFYNEIINISDIKPLLNSKSIRKTKELFAKYAPKN